MSVTSMCRDEHLGESAAFRVGGSTGAQLDRRDQAHRRDQGDVPVVGERQFR